MRLILLCILGIIWPLPALEIFEEVFRWKQLDFDWPSKEVKDKITSKNGFDPINNSISGIKVWGTSIYLTLPRFREGVAVTLARIPYSSSNQTQSPKLQAYPSYDMQIIGDCNAFQHVQSMEIDPKGRMWVIDTGRVNLLELLGMTAECPPRLVILDIEKNGEVILSYEFPSEVTNHKMVILDDIVVDSTDGGYAYITDSNFIDPGIIVYSVKQNKSWKVRDSTMFPELKGSILKINHEIILLPFPVDGIALSPLGDNDRYVYYCALSAYHLYSIPTKLLKNSSADAKSAIKDLGERNSVTDGLIMTADGTMYLGLNHYNSIGSWRPTESKISDGIVTIDKDDEKLIWADSFAIDRAGNLWMTTDRLLSYVNKHIDPNEYNFRVLKAPIGVNNYQYYPDGSEPEF